MLSHEQRFALNRDGKHNDFSFVFYPTPVATDLTVTVINKCIYDPVSSRSRELSIDRARRVRCTVRPVLSANYALFIRMQSFSERNERRVHKLYASLLLTDETLPPRPQANGELSVDR